MHYNNKAYIGIKTQHENKNKTNNAISLMRRKSPPSENLGPGKVPAPQKNKNNK